MDSDDHDVRLEITFYFRSRWIVPYGGPNSLILPPSLHTPLSQNKHLTSLVLEEEVREAPWSLVEDSPRSGWVLPYVLQTILEYYFL